MAIDEQVCQVSYTYSERFPRAWFFFDNYNWSFRDGHFCIEFCMDKQNKRATSVAHLTNFSFEICHAVFTQKASLPFHTIMQKSQNWPKVTQIRREGGGGAENVEFWLHLNLSSLTLMRRWTTWNSESVLDRSFSLVSRFILPTAVHVNRNRNRNRNLWVDASYQIGHDHVPNVLLRLELKKKKRKKRKADKHTELE